MTKVKICGITSLEDARFAIECGADALGFNFYKPSPRFVDPRVASSIAVSLPPHVLKVGVFVNEDLDAIAHAVTKVGLDAVQLHGDEPPEFVDSVRRELTCTVIKAFRVSAEFQPSEAAGYNADYILLDGFRADQRGGTGETFDWEIARRVACPDVRLYLAGGLNPENVRRAVAEVSPFAVDACSGVERSPGTKDAEKVRRFIYEAKLG